RGWGRGDPMSVRRAATAARLSLARPHRRGSRKSGLGAGIVVVITIGLLGLSGPAEAVPVEAGAVTASGAHVHAQSAGHRLHSTDWRHAVASARDFQRLAAIAAEEGDVRAVV